MSADLLRRAATELRNAAREAEPGPWVAETTDRGSAWINFELVPHAWGLHGWPDSAEYVALMHPPVALLLADWLEVVAVWPESHLHGHPSVAVARAILREES